MTHFLRILQYLKKYTPRVILNIAFNILSVLFSLVSITMLAPFLQLLFLEKISNDFKVHELPEWSLSVNYFIDLFKHNFTKIIIEQGKVDALIFICVTVIVIFFLKNLFRYAALFFLAPVRHGIVKDIRNELFSKLLSLPLSFYSNEKKGDVLTRMTSDVSEIESGIISMLEITFREPITILVYLAAMIL